MIDGSATENASPSAQPRRNGVAIASLVLGVISLLLFCMPWISIPAAISAIVLGVTVRRRPISVDKESMTMATVGAVCGTAALVLAAIVISFMVLRGTLFERPVDTPAGPQAPPQMPQPPGDR